MNLALEHPATVRSALPQPTGLSGGLRGPLAVLEGAFGVELHEGTCPRGKRRTAARHRGRLHGLEEFAFGRPMLNSPLHMCQDTLLAGAAKGQDAEDAHFPILDGQRLALPDREFR